MECHTQITTIYQHITFVVNSIFSSEDITLDVVRTSYGFQCHFGTSWVPRVGIIDINVTTENIGFTPEDFWFHEDTHISQLFEPIGFLLIYRLSDTLGFKDAQEITFPFKNTLWDTPIHLWCGHIWLIRSPKDNILTLWKNLQPVLTYVYHLSLRKEEQ